MKGLTAPERARRQAVIEELSANNRRGKTTMPPKEVREYIAKLEEDIEQLQTERAAAGKRAMEAEKENERLREAVKEAADAFDAASEGGGVNFYAYAESMKAALEEEE